jgi:hypothetical protein
MDGRTAGDRGAESNARPSYQSPGRSSGFGPEQSAGQFSGGAQRPAYTGPGAGNYSRGNAGQQQPSSAARPAYNYPSASQPGHLGAWLNQHSNAPTQEKERMLRSEPSFSRLPSGEQQRLMQQLHQVDNLNDQQRQRRLARANALEHLSPQERMGLNRSNQSFSTLPANRQALMKHAFQDLRSVPLDQRQTVLNSSRYQGTFSPQERGILSDFLRVEPYEPQR